MASWKEEGGGASELVQDNIGERKDKGRGRQKDKAIERK